MYTVSFPSLKVMLRNLLFRIVAFKRASCVRFLASSWNLRKGVVAGDIQLPAAVPPHTRDCFRFIFLHFMPSDHNFLIFRTQSEKAKLDRTAFKSHKYSYSLKKASEAVCIEIQNRDQKECRH
jgi:hypothetical protein